MKIDTILCNMIGLRSKVTAIARLGLALAFAISVSPVLATTIAEMSAGGIGAARGPAAESSAAKVAKPLPTKLTLGLDILHAEYKTYKEALATGITPPSPFASKRTVATVIKERVVIDAAATDDPKTLKADLEALGAEVMAIAGRLVSARLPLDKLAGLEALSSLRFARPAWATTRTGVVTTQGDEAQDSRSARLDFGVDGAGSTVGVLSDSFDCSARYAVDIATGDLPVGVKILDDSACPGSDEGRAMAQIIHDVAPGAGLAFHTAFNGEADFAQGILELAGAGSTVIVDDVLYLAEPMFQDGVIAQAVDTVDASGVSYFSAAGNEARNAYQSPLNGSGLLGQFGGELHDFDPGPGVDTRLTLRQTGITYYAMQWQDPFFSVSGPPGASTDLDVCFYAPPGASSPFFCAADFNIGGDPLEGVALSGEGLLEISIERYAGPVPNLIKVVILGAPPFEEAYPGVSAGTVYGHANAVHANAVGAAAYFFTPAFGQDPPVLNDYSSAGNTPILFSPAGNPINSIRAKPQFTAPDGGNNTFLGFDWEPDGFPNFFGTSASVAHAAAVAALLRERDPVLAPADITRVLQNTAVDILERSTSTALGPSNSSSDRIGPGYDSDSGSGLIDARAAIGATALEGLPSRGGWRVILDADFPAR